MGGESKSTNETEVKLVTSTADELKSASNDTTRLSPSVSVESVAQPTTSSLSTLKLAKMAETAINSKQNKDLKLQMKMGGKTDTEAPFVAKISGQKKQPKNSNGKVDIVAIKNGRNVVRISDNDQDRDPKDQSPDSDNNEVSRILLNMSGVGTISVTKYEGVGLKQMDVKNNRKKGGGAQENQITVDKQRTEEYVVESEDDESDGFSGFDFEETSNIPEAGEFMKDKSGEPGEETFVVGELVPSECIQFEHLEVDRNGSVHIAENESQKTDKLELEDSMK